MRVLVVSHACSVPVNRDVYAVLGHAHGHQVELVVPEHWPAAYAGSDSDDGDLVIHRLPVGLAGRVQRHFYRL